MQLENPKEFQTALEIYKTESIIGEGGSCSGPINLDTY